MTRNRSAGFFGSPWKEPITRSTKRKPGKRASTEIVYRRPDVVLLDLGLPDMEGVKVLRDLREWSDVPVLILSVRDDAEEKVAALDAGADDYVTKPFDTAELLARVRAAQRRSLTETGEPVFKSGSLCVDFSARQVKLDGKEIKLTPTEYSLLRVLVQNAGKVVTHRQLLRTVWGEKAESQAQYLRVYVTHLRKKLEADADMPRASSRPKSASAIDCRPRAFSRREASAGVNELLAIRPTF